MPHETGDLGSGYRSCKRNPATQSDRMVDARDPRDVKWARTTANIGAHVATLVERLASPLYSRDPSERDEHTGRSR